MNVLSNPIYIREKHAHDKYCNGDGEIISINKFNRDVQYIPCQFCKRIKDYKAKKLAEQKGGSNG